MRSLKMIIVIAVVIVLGQHVFSGDADWPHFKGPNYDGNPVTKPFDAASLQIIWEAQVYTGMSSMSIVDGRLYTMGNIKNIDVVTCLNASDGKEIWTHKYPCELTPNLYEGGPSTTPTVHEGKVYTISKYGDIFCLDARSGKPIWEASAKAFFPENLKWWWGFAGSATIAGDVACFNASGKGLGLNKRTGDVIWSGKPGIISYSTIIPLPESMLKKPAIAVLTNDALKILNPADGRPVAQVADLWPKRGNCNAVSPAVHEGQLYITHSTKGMMRLSRQGDTFKPVWDQRDAALNWHTFNNRVFHKGRFYFLAKKKGLCCLDITDGKLLWNDGNFAFGNLLLVGDTLFVLEESGKLSWGPLTKAPFKAAHTMALKKGRYWSHPVIHNGCLFARSARGYLVCGKFR